MRRTNRRPHRVLLLEELEERVMLSASPLLDVGGGDEDLAPNTEVDIDTSGFAAAEVPGADPGVDVMPPVPLTAPTGGFFGPSRGPGAAAAAGSTLM